METREPKDRATKMNHVEAFIFGGLAALLLLQWWP